MTRDWIVTRIRRNLLADSRDEYPLLVSIVNLNHEGSGYGAGQRYNEWRVADVYNPRYDLGNAVIDDDVPSIRLQESRRFG